MEIDRNKPLVTLTVGDLMDILMYLDLKTIKPAVVANQNLIDNQGAEIKRGDLVDSKELADILHISRSALWRLRKSGILNNCTYYIGTRRVVFDKSKVLEALEAVNKMPWN